MPGYVRTASVLASVHEDPFFLGMRMQVDEHEAILLLKNSPLCEIYLWTAVFVVAVPDPIQVIARETASVIAVDDSIRIQHRYDLENKVVSQSLCLFPV